MLESSALNALLSNSPQQRDSKSKDEEGDSEAFGSALQQANAPKSKKSPEKSTKESKTSRAESKETEEARPTPPPQDRLGAIHLKKLMSQNLDTMTLAEKQALRVAEFANPEFQANKNLPGVSREASQLQARNQDSNSKSSKFPKSTDPKSPAAPSSEVKESAEPNQRPGKTPPEGQAQGESQRLREVGFAEELRKTQVSQRSLDRQNLIEQILQQIEVKNFASRTELNFKLNPEYLGELKIKLVHSDEGIRADFETSSQSTRQLLRDSEDELRTQANGKGIRLKSTRVTLVDEREQQSSNQG